MHRSINWLAFSIAPLFLSTSLTLSGCGGGGGEDGQGAGNEPPAVSGMLRKARSAAELEGSLKASLRQMTLAGPPSGPVVLPTASGENSFSNTYTSEAGVDEFDYVRYDGTHLYIAPVPYASLQLPREVRILKTEPVSGTATPVSSIPIEGDQQVQGIYVADGRLVMLTSQYTFTPFGAAWIAPFWWAPTDHAIQVFDVSDPAHPAQLFAADVDGAFVASRRVGDRVYLVSRHTPAVLFDPPAGPNFASLPLAALLPQITRDGRTLPLVDPENCYLTNEPGTNESGTNESGNQGYPILTTITSFSMQNPGDFTSICYNEESNGIYASTKALYVSQPRIANSSAMFTRIHKFSFTDAAPAYAGSVEVPGLLWMGGQQDFRMSEHQGLLRVVTTESSPDPADRQDHRLFVLRPKSSGLALEVVSSLPSAARPAELGKPNESLYAVRFVGERAYAVTFRQIDPLYVLDLANPADPRIAAELVIPGFSELLHPVTQNLLLGLGSDTGRLKLELFDVSSLEAPQSRGRIELEGWSSYSEAEYDRHAFTYLPGDAADRVAIPATTTHSLPSGLLAPPRSSLYQFEIIGKQQPGSASLQSAGMVAPPFVNDYESYTGTARSFIHGDTVFYIRDGKVWSTSWFAPSQLQGPF